MRSSRIKQHRVVGTDCFFEMQYVRLSCRCLLILISVFILPRLGLGDESSSQLKPTVADYRYGKDSPSQSLDFWQAKSEKPTPVVIMIHGGGWLNGDKSQYDPSNIQPFLDAGISAVSINYRLIPEAMTHGVNPPVKACLLDAARAVQTVRSKAKEWNIDPQRVGATGSSAGACSSLWLALHDDLANPKSDDPIARESTRFTCVGVYRAQTTLDPLEFREWISNADYGGQAFGFYNEGRSSMESFEMLLANREKLLPLINEYSPIRHASRTAPPIYINYPKQTTPPVEGQPDPAPAHSAIHGIKLAEKLRKFGTEIVVTYPGNEDKKYESINNFLVDKLMDN